jgi:FKBP-type peptidyl-prolyl cis-trans isomerase FklB
MLKTSIKATLAAGTLLLGNALAQTPAAPTQPTSPAKPKSTTTPAKKATTTKPAAAPLALKSQKEKFSYALGMNVGQGLGQTLKRQDIAIDPAILARGLKDALAGTKTALTEQEAKDILTKVQNDLRAKQQAKTQEEAAGNKKAGEAFAAANKAKDGVVVLPSGLQYKVLTVGTGPKPTTADTVVCNYSGTLTDGKEFDSSYKRGEPATFPVTGVIKGWTEALQLMPVGSKWQLVIPSDLAYGDAGRPGIPPGATLVFEVELMSIKEKSADAAPDKAAPEEKK